MYVLYQLVKSEVKQYFMIAVIGLLGLASLIGIGIYSWLIEAEEIRSITPFT